MAKIHSEEETRKRFLQLAREGGCEAEFIATLRRFEDFLKGCKTDEERKAVQAMAALEIHALFGGGGELIVNGQKLK